MSEYYTNNVLVEVYMQAPSGSSKYVEISNSTSGAVFWGVFEMGNEPTPPLDDKVHYGFRIPAP